MLKFIALISMIIDHLGILFYHNHTIDILYYIGYRYIGRISFILFGIVFAYNIVNYVRDINKTSNRLLFFGIFSQIPYSLFFEKYNLNIFFTFLVALFIYKALDNIINNYLFNKNNQLDYVFVFKNISIIAFFSFFSIFFISYGIIGVYFIVFSALYFKYNKKYLLITLFILMFILNNLSYFLVPLLFVLLWKIIFHILKKENKFLNTFFYIFYPLHLLILYLFKT